MKNDVFLFIALHCDLSSELLQNVEPEMKTWVQAVYLVLISKEMGVREWRGEAGKD